MFKAHNISASNYSSTLSKFPSFPSSKSRRRRSGVSNMSLALLSACPINVFESRSIFQAPCVDYIDYNTATQDDMNNTTSNCTHINDSASPSGHHDEHHVDTQEPVISKPFYYPNEKIFDAALELYNLQNASEGESSGSSITRQRWECKGEIRASFQLCILCLDLGKARSYTEKYYLDVMEVRKYRTILCKGCLGYILNKHVGSCIVEIEKRLKELKAKTQDI